MSASGLILYPHGLFLTEFEALLGDAERQEKIHLANTGEVAHALKIKLFIEKQVIPAIRISDWVFQGTQEFVERYLADCFEHLKLGGAEAYSAQKRVHDLNDKVVDLLARASLTGVVPKAGEVDLTKASDFLALIDFGSADSDLRSAAEELHAEAIEQESLHLRVTLRGIRDLYETTLPRIMYVVKRAIKFHDGIPQRPSDQDLLGVSETLDWYDNHIGQSHLLFPVIGNLRSFYRLVRNVASHHKGLEWDPQADNVILVDNTQRLEMHLYEFQQRYRLLLYLCEFGFCGILWAFCDRERGELSNQIVRDYQKTFPEHFPEGLPARVRFNVL